MLIEFGKIEMNSDYLINFFILLFTEN